MVEGSSLLIDALHMYRYNGAEELLLNHLTTPNVLVRSAVVASCSLPGILRPSKLLSKVSTILPTAQCLPTSTTKSNF